VLWSIAERELAEIVSAVRVRMSDFVKFFIVFPLCKNFVEFLSTYIRLSRFYFVD
jgi:hypothetical protein